MEAHDSMAAWPQAGKQAKKLAALDAMAAPPWVEAVLGADVQEDEPFEKEGVLVQTRRVADALWIRAHVPNAATLEDRAFQAAVARCYVIALEYVQGAELEPVRIWNFVPEIRRPTADGYSRYEVFNAGRQQGVREVLGADPAERPVTASGVGHAGDEFVVQILAAPAAAVPVENPRQCPSYHYSERYGVQPPLFARASRMADGPGALGPAPIGLVSGTASIVGEDSTHEGDLAGQLQETLLNLATVAGELSGRPLGFDPSGSALAEALGLYREVRVYVVREADAPQILKTISEACPAAAHVELVGAQLCRPELLVEAEGILLWE